jgi:hypothetical protein
MSQPESLPLSSIVTVELIPSFSTTPLEVNHESIT